MASYTWEGISLPPSIIKHNKRGCIPWKSLRILPLLVLHPSLVKLGKSCLRHQGASFKVPASFFVQFSPVAVFPSRGEPLCQTAVGESFARRVYPSETQGFLNDRQVRERIFSWLLATVACHPALLVRPVILLQPAAELIPVAEFKQEVDFHDVTDEGWTVF